MQALAGNRKLTARAAARARKRKKHIAAGVQANEQKTNRVRVRGTTRELVVNLKSHARSTSRAREQNSWSTIRELQVNAQARAVNHERTPTGARGTLYYIDTVSDKCSKCFIYRTLKALMVDR